MKVSFDIDCTPAEARAFLGLPDLSSVHAVYLDKMRAFAGDGLSPADYERLIKTWMPGMAESFDSWRQTLFAAGRAKPE